MAKHSGTCNCGTGSLTTEVTITVRIMSEHRDEARTVLMCQPCAEATVVNGLGTWS